MHTQDQNVVLLAPEALPKLPHKQVALLKSNDPSTHVQTHKGITAYTGALEPGGFATDCRVVTELSLQVEGHFGGGSSSYELFSLLSTSSHRSGERVNVPASLQA